MTDREEIIVRVNDDIDRHRVLLTVQVNYLNLSTIDDVIPPPSIFRRSQLTEKFAFELSRLENAIPLKQSAKR